MADAFIGEIRLFASWPRFEDDWLPCDGRELPARRHQLLAHLLGQSSQVNLRLPDLRGRVLTHGSSRSAFPPHAGTTLAEAVPDLTVTAWVCVEGTFPHPEFHSTADAWVGDLRAFVTTSIPAGWLPCDGRTLEVGEDTRMLAAVMHPDRDVESITEITVPDLRERVPVASGASTTNAPQPGESADVTWCVASVGIFPHRDARWSEAYLSELRFSLADFRGSDAWAVADGARGHAAHHQPLFSLLGHAFGGEDWRFHLPDLRGRTVRIAGGYDELGQTRGSVSAGTTRPAELPVHAYIAQNGRWPQ